ncbi:MAG: hypothetical protein NTZ25_05505 [Candidatus Peregrinibacteria bacterium]|nr:hypothetical protein [Candidatus Peregrinibacteria bacterium]
MSIKGLDDSDGLDPTDLEEMPTIRDTRWSLDFRGASIPAASKDPEAIKVALAARLRRIDNARDRDPWLDTASEVRSISERVRESTVNVEVPSDATHKIVGGLFADTYAINPRVTEDGQAFYVVMVSGSRKGMMTRVDFDQFTKVDGIPDYKLRGLLSAAPKGKPRTNMGANKLRKSNK